MQGTRRYIGATPSYVIWNLVERYTKPGDLVVDPFCGSGTTLDVAKDTGPQARAASISRPTAPDIERADARKLPLESGSVDLVFMDPPYGDHIDYSDDPSCIGKLSAYDPRYYQAMHRAIREARARAQAGRRPRPVRLRLLREEARLRAGGLPALRRASPSRSRSVDIVAVVRHNKSLEMGNYRKAAEEGNFFLRGFNYLFIAQKPDDRPQPKPRA